MPSKNGQLFASRAKFGTERKRDAIHVVHNKHNEVQSNEAFEILTCYAGLHAHHIRPSWR